VKVDYQPPRLTVKGGKATLERVIHPKVILELNDGVIKVTPADESREARALWGLFRTLVFNMVVGVSEGFTKVLDVVGIGYRAEAKGQTLNLALGYSKPVEFPLPEGVTAEVDKQNRITLRSADKELLGQTAADVRALRPPEPYKGKGIKYSDEVIQRKVGKAGGK
jgi:large subunit ribosomal protein L6